MIGDSDTRPWQDRVRDPNSTYTFPIENDVYSSSWADEARSLRDDWDGQKNAPRPRRPLTAAQRAKRNRKNAAQRAARKRTRERR